VARGCFQDPSPTAGNLSEAIQRLLQGSCSEGKFSISLWKQFFTFSANALFIAGQLQQQWWGIRWDGEQSACNSACSHNCMGCNTLPWKSQGRALLKGLGVRFCQSRPPTMLTLNAQDPKNYGLRHRCYDLGIDKSCPIQSRAAHVTCPKGPET
jgi:hypothetical protein